MLVASELTTNAILHSGAEPGSEIELRAEIIAGAIVIEVIDVGRSKTSPRAQPSDLSSPGGLGLHVVAAVARRWGSERRDGMRVWAELALSAPSSGPSRGSLNRRGTFSPSPGCAGGTILSVPDRLYFSDSDEANALIATDPMALLIGFALDQQVTVQKAFAGPLVLRERLGSLDADAVSAADLEPIFRERPAIHRFPGSMANRVHELAVYIRDHYDGDAERVWRDAPDGDTLRANLASLPGFGEMKVKSLGAVLAKRFGVAAAQDLVPWHPTLGDVDSPEALAAYQTTKKAHKAEWQKARAGAA